MTARRELAGTVLLCLAGAFVVLVAAGREWTRLAVPAGPLTGGSVVGLTGTDLVPGVRALGLVGLGAVVALAATRRTGRVVVGALLLLAGAGVLLAVVGTDLAAVSLRDPRLGDAEVPVATSVWPAVTVGGGGLLVLAGSVTVLRGRSWPGLGQRYEAPGRAPSPDAEPAAAAVTERSLWEALDRGEDPTDTLEDPPGVRLRGEDGR